MNSLFVATVVFACAFGGGLVGIVLHQKLPEHHLESDSKDAVKLVLGLVASVFALVLGLLIYSARISYGTQVSAVQHLGAGIGQLDQVLAIYGPETNETRDFLRQYVAGELNRIWPNDSGAAVKLSELPARHAADELAERIVSLSPQTEIQRHVKNRALQLVAQLAETRRLLYEESSGFLSWAFLAVLMSWLVALFVGYGFLTRYSAAILTALFAGAICVAGAMFLVVDVNLPYSGLMHISSAPIRNALDHIGR
jgi:hypothetical protein